LTAESLGWQDEHLLDHRRHLRTAMVISLAVHGLILALFAVTPPTPVAPMPEYLAVELVAAPPPGAATPRPPVAPAPEPEPEPEPAAPEPPPVAPPPMTKAPVQVLPEESPGKIRKVEPKAPDVVAKAEPKPVPKPAPRKRRKKEKALSYEDAMAELGLDDPSEALVPTRAAGSPESENEASDAEAQARPGLKVPPEVIAWDRAVSALIKKRFPNFSRFQGRGLVTQIEVDVLASGSLAREPRLIGTSGDLDFDRMIIAVVERAAPLPPPPRPGVRKLSLKSDQ
jgi:outer membrane biosynthesis protein TonB